MKPKRVITEYLDGRLPPAKLAAFEARLGADAELAREVAEQRRVIELLATLPAEAAPAPLTSKIMAGIGELPVPVRRPSLIIWLLDQCQPRKVAWATLAAAVLVVAGSSIRPDSPGHEFTAPRAAASHYALSDTDAAFVQLAEREYHLVLAERPAAAQVDSGTIDDVLRGL